MAKQLKSMHICHVNLATHFNGGENQTYELIKHQIGLGYDITVVVKANSKLHKKISTLSCSVIPVRHFVFGHLTKKASSFDVVHIHEGKATYWGLINHYLYKTPYVITRRIDNVISQKWITKHAYSKASATVGLSNTIVNRLLECNPEQNVLKIPSSPVSYPVSDTNVSQIKERFGNKFIIIQAANMLKHKGFDLTIEAAKKLATSHPSIHFCLLGDGKDMPFFQSLAVGLNNVTFVGKQENMGDWFKAANLQVHPSYNEGLGSVILEGMKAGLVVIGSNSGGIPDIIQHKHNGLLSQPGCSQSLCESIAYLHDNPDLVHSMAKASSKTIEKFSLTVASKMYEKLYFQVMEQTDRKALSENSSN
ncbi:glycosyltransferase family 4 protein [Vibrio astriarenae]|nr:glycosyltransferase family 4 protein [Vibrio astriarenae]